MTPELQKQMAQFIDDQEEEFWRSFAHSDLDTIFAGWRMMYTVIAWLRVPAPLRNIITALS